MFIKLTRAALLAAAASGHLIICDETGEGFAWTGCYSKRVLRRKLACMRAERIESGYKTVTFGIDTRDPVPFY